VARSEPRRVADFTTAAEAAGVSRRTLQRVLAKHGTSYSLLRDELRFTTATRLLEFTALAIVDIAFVLGYSDKAHFTRAFKRWCGVSPAQYRKRTNRHIARAGRPRGENRLADVAGLHRR
jgi:AraC-like DNA-binding protein